MQDGGAHYLSIGNALLRWAIRALTATVWFSSALFALFILAFYLGAWRLDEMEAWNAFLPGLHAEDGQPAATAGIGVHFVFGAMILLLGPIQLVREIRDRWPRAHHWIGRVYVASAVLTGLGGLGFIVLRGTVGGPMMSLSFALYGVLMIVAGFQTIRHAMAWRFEQHRAWALRLFALAVGSWLYRMYYGLWFAVADGAGHNDAFDGWFDQVMNLWFFLPNLLVAEIVIRAARPRLSLFAASAASAAMVGVTMVLMLATWFFFTQAWLPAIAWGLGI